jgi:hypothetical protein
VVPGRATDTGQPGQTASPRRPRRAVSSLASCLRVNSLGRSGPIIADMPLRYLVMLGPGCAGNQSQEVRS